MPRVLSIFGTRPEAVKMGLSWSAWEPETFQSLVCITAQHRGMMSVPHKRCGDGRASERIVEVLKGTVSER